jgi:hypothetical protein
MDAPPRPYRERQREAREEAQRRTRLSTRLGVLGIVILFASGLGTWLLTAYVLAFLGGMVFGILLILEAFLLVRRSVLNLKIEDRTKIS